MKTTRFTMIFFVTLILVTACVSKTKYVDLENDLETTREQIDKKNNEIRGLEEKRKELLGQIAEMENQLEEKENALKEKNELFLLLVSYFKFIFNNYKRFF
jgi:chemotaxis protein MotB